MQASGIVALLVVTFVALHAVIVPTGAAAPKNDRPIIGILTQPSSASMKRFGDNYIAASYVKVSREHTTHTIHNSTR